MTKNKGGRPSVITKEVLQKLKEGFLFGMTDREASFYAGISERTLANYQKANVEFLQEKAQWKDNPISQARIALHKNIQRGNGDLALKYLERKVKDELSLRTEHSGTNGEPIEFIWKEE